MGERQHTLLLFYESQSQKEGREDVKKKKKSIDCFLISHISLFSFWPLKKLKEESHKNGQTSQPCV